MTSSPLENIAYLYAPDKELAPVVGPFSCFPPERDGGGGITHESIYLALRVLEQKKCFVQSAPLILLDWASLTRGQQQAHVAYKDSCTVMCTVLVGSAPGLKKCRCEALGPVLVRMRFSNAMALLFRKYCQNMSNFLDPDLREDKPINTPLFVDVACYHCGDSTKVSVTTKQLYENPPAWLQEKPLFGRLAVAHAIGLLAQPSPFEPSKTPLYRLVCPGEENPVAFPDDVASLAVWRVLRQRRPRGGAGCVQAERCVVVASHGPAGPWIVWTPRVPDNAHQSPVRAGAAGVVGGAVPPPGWEARMARREGSSIVSRCEVCQSETWLSTAKREDGPLTIATLDALRHWAHDAAADMKQLMRAALAGPARPMAGEGDEMAMVD